MWNTARGALAPPPSALVKNPMVSLTNDHAKTASVLAMTGDAGNGSVDGGGALHREDGDGGAPAEASRLVIVVDDDRSIVEGLALLLEAWGYDVLTALSLNELAQRLPQAPGRPGLVLADHFLPAGGTGAQAVEMVRAHVGAPVPALILTGDTMPERQAEAAALGCRLLHKPVQIGPLKDMVDTLMSGAG